MKKSIYILSTLFLFLLSNPIFAQADPGADPDAPPAPIDDYIWVLSVVGLIYVFIWFKAFVKKVNISKK